MFKKCFFQYTIKMSLCVLYMKKDITMNESYFQIARWIANYLGEEKNKEEELLLEEWRRNPENEELLRKIEAHIKSRLGQKRYDDFSCEYGWHALQNKRHFTRRLSLSWIRCAAAIFVVFGLSFLLLLTRDSQKDKAYLVVTDEAYSKNAKLVLADGQEIDLEEQHGVVADTLPFITNGEKCLIYQDHKTSIDKSPVYHEILIPAGGEYQLRLSDGTLVYLNSMTKLRFPDVFIGAVREVELEGEAYFNVIKNPDKPFIVKSQHSRVLVYGTQFNISAYPDDTQMHTTLVEGALSVEHANVEHKLQPGNQWNLDLESGDARVSVVDVSLYTAWRDGKLRFNNARLEDIMRKVGRWYGVEISFQEESLKDLRFGCNFSRYKSIEPILRIFEANGKIKIEKHEYRLMIKRGR